jgi:DNA-binding XRE family transcriptional regulator
MKIFHLAGFSLCRLTGSDVLHIRPPDPCGVAADCGVHEFAVGTLCAHAKAHPEGRDVWGTITEELLASAGCVCGVCGVCAAEYRRRFEATMPAPAAEPLIGRVRRAMGDTQVEFARRVGVSEKTVSFWENGHTSPSRTVWLLLALLAPARPKCAALVPEIDAMKEEAGDD